jgi:hypothetical protein
MFRRPLLGISRRHSRSGRRRFLREGSVLVRRGSAVESGRGGACVRGNDPSAFKCANLLRGTRQCRWPEKCGSRCGREGKVPGSALDQTPYIKVGSWVFRSAARSATSGGAEKRDMAPCTRTGRRDIAIEMRGHLMQVATLPIQTDPPARAIRIVVLHPHCDGRADPREREHQYADQCPVAQPDKCWTYRYSPGRRAPGRGPAPLSGWRCRRISGR